MQRHLDWEGTWNARHLGGLTAEGGLTRLGTLLRSENLDRLTSRGWASLHDYGVRTLIDLRNSEEREAKPYQPPAGIRVFHAPLEEGLHEDSAFKTYMTNGWWGTALYFKPFLELWPDRCAAALAQIAMAPPGGVLVHCAKGSDRTGMMITAVLALVGVKPEEIVADYLLTAQRLATPRAKALDWEDDATGLAEVYAREDTGAVEVLSSLLREFDFQSLVTSEQALALRRRLLSA